MANVTSYKDLSKVLAEIQRGKVAPVYLLYGDEFLCKSALKALLDAVVPTSARGLNYEALDGAMVSIHEIVGRLNTFPLLPSAKVIAVHGAKTFYSSMSADELLRRSREAFERQDLNGAARYFFHLLMSSGLSLDDLSPADRQGVLDQILGDNLRGAKQGVGPWLDQVVEYCLGEQMNVSSRADDADVLNEAIVAGFPKTNHLFLTTEFVDKRRKLYKTIEKMGVAIDCSIAKGEKAADKRQQKAMLKAQMAETLRSVCKTMGPGGFEALYEKTGPSLRTFSNELEKLITFVGDRGEILARDVEQASEKTKQDPIYELANAIGERNPQKALFFLDSLLKANLFPLQVLSAAVNQVRKLILARDCAERSPGGGWIRGMSYGAFQRVVLPELDKTNGYILAGNAHPYVVYKTFVHSDNYTFEELSDALEILLDADIRLKTSGQDAKIVLEHAVLQICSTPAKPPAHRSEQN